MQPRAGRAETRYCKTAFEGDGWVLEAAEESNGRERRVFYQWGSL